MFLEIYLRLLRTSATATTTVIMAATAIAMYSVIDGASLLGGGATEADVVGEGEADCVAEAV